MSTRDTKDDREAHRQKMIEHYHEAKLVRKIVMIVSVVVFLLIALIGGGSLRKLTFQLAHR